MQLALHRRKEFRMEELWGASWPHLHIPPPPPPHSMSSISSSHLLFFHPVPNFLYSSNYFTHFPPCLSPSHSLSLSPINQPLLMVRRGACRGLPDHMEAIRNKQGGTAEAPRTRESPHLTTACRYCTAVCGTTVN